MIEALRLLADEAELELKQHILPYWMKKTVDEDYGGFVGQIAGSGEKVPDAPKGAVLNARILWTFAAAYGQFKENAYLEMAERAYQYIVEHFIDDRFGGVYWMLSCAGQPVEDKKQVYAQSFAIYAFSEYAKAAGNQEALNHAIAIYQLLERHAHDSDNGGYIDAFGHDWTSLADRSLSDKDLNAAKTMNTHLHVMEAYAALARVWNNEKLSRRLGELIQIHIDRILDRTSMHLSLYFDEIWTPLSEIVSYGHDIEASWLLTEAADGLGIESLSSDVAHIAIRMVDQTIRQGIEPTGAVWNERFSDGRIDTNRHWWPQVEAIVGLVNAYQLTGKPHYLDLAEKCWHYCRSHLVDRSGGEWHWGVTPSGRPMENEDKVGPWKGPYHHSRMCLEMIQRSEAIDNTPR